MHIKKSKIHLEKFVGAINSAHQEYKTRPHVIDAEKFETESKHLNAQAEAAKHRATQLKNAAEEAKRLAQAASKAASGFRADRNTALARQQQSTSQTKANQSNFQSSQQERKAQTAAERAKAAAAKTAFSQDMAKALGRFGDRATAVMGGMSMGDAWRKGDMNEVGRTSSSFLGSVGGAKYGAIAGAFLAGLATGGVGWIIAGAAIGAGVGGYFGSEMGEGAWDKFHDDFQSLFERIFEAFDSPEKYAEKYAESDIYDPHTHWMARSGMIDPWTRLPHRSAHYVLVDPLALDLDGDGLETLAVSGFSGSLFDHDGDGIRSATGWLKGDDGFLVRDLNGNGRIDNGGELFGDHTVLKNNTRAPHGYAALAELDDNADGKIDAKDKAFASLRIWQDKNQDGISQTGELSTLSALGIRALNTAYQDSKRHRFKIHSDVSTEKINAPMGGFFIGRRFWGWC